MTGTAPQSANPGIHINPAHLSANQFFMSNSQQLNNLGEWIGP